MVERKICLLSTRDYARDCIPAKFLATTCLSLWHVSPVAAAMIEADLDNECVQAGWAEILETAYYVSEFDGTVYKLRMEEDGLYAVAVQRE